MKCIFKSFSNLWIPLLLKRRWRNGKSMAGSSNEARGVEILGSSRLSSSQGLGMKTKGVVFSHHPCGVPKHGGLAPQLCRHHMGSILMMMISPWWLWYSPSRSFRFDLGWVRWKSKERGGWEKDHEGWKRVMNFKQTTWRLKDRTPQKSFNTS